MIAAQTKARMTPPTGTRDTRFRPPELIAGPAELLAGAATAPCGRSVNRPVRSFLVRACSARPDRSSNSSWVIRPAWKCSLSSATAWSRSASDTRKSPRGKLLLCVSMAGVPSVDKPCSMPDSLNTTRRDAPRASAYELTSGTPPEGGRVEKCRPLDDGSIPPLEYPQRAEGVPAARRAHAFLEIEIDAPRMDVVEQPPAVGLPLRPHDVHRLRHPRIRVRARPAEVVERAQHVVVPVVGKRELQIRGPYHVPRALAPEQSPLQQVLLTAPASLAHLRGPAGRALELEQAVEHVHRRVEGGPHRSVLDLAVPAAVSEPLGKDALDERAHVHPEVGPALDRPSVDAGLDLPVEEPLPVVLPAPVLRDKPDRPAGGLRRRVKPEKLQGLQGVHGGRPRLPWFTASVASREASPAGPQPVGILEGEQARAPAIALHPGSLGR